MALNKKGRNVKSGKQQRTERVAIDELYREVSPTDPKLFYFPSYEVVMYLFNNIWLADRRHVSPRLLQFNMEIFERYYCASTFDDAALLRAFKVTRNNDRKLGNTEIQNARRQALVQRNKENDNPAAAPPQRPGRNPALKARGSAPSGMQQRAGRNSPQAQESKAAPAGFWRNALSKLRMW